MLAHVGGPRRGHRRTRLRARQLIQAANAGRAISMTWDFLLSGLDAGSTLRLQVQRGNLGSTTASLFDYAETTR
jgi:hypothetical protein